MMSYCAIEHWEKELVDTCPHESKYRVVDDRDATIICSKCCIVLANSTYMHSSLTRTTVKHLNSISGGDNSSSSINQPTFAAVEIYETTYLHEICEKEEEEERGGEGGEVGEVDASLQNFSSSSRVLLHNNCSNVDDENEFPLSFGRSRAKIDMFVGKTKGEGERKASGKVKRCNIIKNTHSSQTKEDDNAFFPDNCREKSARRANSQILTDLQIAATAPATCMKKQKIKGRFVLLDWIANAHLPLGILDSTLKLFESEPCQRLVYHQPRTKISSKALQEIELLAGCLFLCLMKGDAARTYCYLAFYTGVAEERLSHVVAFLSTYLNQRQHDQPSILNSLKPSIWIPLFGSEFLLSYQDEIIVKRAADHWQNEYSFSPLTLTMTSIYIFYTRRPKQLSIWWQDYQRQQQHHQHQEERKQSQSQSQKRIGLRLKLSQALKKSLVEIVEREKEATSSSLSPPPPPPPLPPPLSLPVVVARTGKAVGRKRDNQHEQDTSRMVAALKKRIVQVSGLNSSTLNRAIKKIESGIIRDIISACFTTATSSVAGGTPSSLLIPPPPPPPPLPPPPPPPPPVSNESQS